MYYLCIDFVFQFIVEKYRNKLNQIKSNQTMLIGLLKTLFNIVEAPLKKNC